MMCQNAWRVMRSPRRVVPGIVRLPFQQYLDPRSLHELLQPFHRFVAQRNQALAVALADHAHHALGEIDLIVLQADELRDPQSRRIQYFEHGAVAMPQRIRYRRRLEQRIDLGFGERFRQRPADFRHGDLRGRIELDQTLANHEAEKAPKTRQLPRRRSRPGSALDARRDETQ